MATELSAATPAANSGGAQPARAPDEAPPTAGDVIERLDKLSAERRSLFIMRLGRGGADDAGMRVVPRPARSRQRPPLSFAQQRLYFLNTYEPDNPSYNMPSALRLGGRLDFGALEQSIGEVIRRHEVLRTTFALAEGQPVQLVSPARRFRLPLVDLSPLARDAREALARRLATAEAQTPFDLRRGPLFRATLLRLDEQDHVLLLTMHHIVSDGESVAILTRELAALYRAFAERRPPPLPELPVQYADFAQWQRDRVRGELLREQLDYWKRHLAGASPLIEVPTARPRPAVRTHRGGTLHVEIPPHLVRSLKEVSRREQVTLFMTLLAAFKVLLYRLSAQDDITVGSGIAGRNQPETEGLIGFFVNTLVLRTRLSGNPTFRELLGRVREVVLGAYAHQDLPFEKIVEELKPERHAGHSPLFQVMFSLLVMPPGAPEFDGLSVSALDYEFGTSKFDMILSLCETTEGVSGYFEYNKDLFDAGAVGQMIAGYLRILAEVAAAPQQPIIHIRLDGGEAPDGGGPAHVGDAVEEFDFLV